MISKKKQRFGKVENPFLVKVKKKKKSKKKITKESQSKIKLYKKKPKTKKTQKSSNISYSSLFRCPLNPFALSIP